MENYYELRFYMMGRSYFCLDLEDPHRLLGKMEGPQVNLDSTFALLRMSSEIYARKFLTRGAHYSHISLVLGGESTES